MAQLSNENGQVQSAITDAAARIIKQRAENLRKSILYEISVANTELAFDGAGDRYGLSALSDVYADSIVIQPIQFSDGSVRTQLVIEASKLKNVKDTEIDFFKKYVLENALHTPQKG